MGTVNIQLSPILEKYIRKVFNCKANGPVKINRIHPIGRFIVANTNYSKEKPKQWHTKPLIIEIPADPYIAQEFLWGFMKRDNERAVVDFIKAMFDLDVQLFYLKGYVAAFTQTEITDLIIRYYNLPLADNVISLLKKRDYRKRKKMIDLKMEIIENY